MKLGQTSRVLDIDSGFGWLEASSTKTAASTTPPITTRILFGDDFPRMIANQAIGLRERRIRTVAFICEA